MTHAERRERREQIAAAVAAGEDLPAITKRFGVCQHTLRWACLEAGVRYPLRVSWKRNAKRHPFDVLAEIKAGKGDADGVIAKRCGLTRGRVQQLRAHARRVGLL